MENTKSSVEINLVQRYGLKKEYDSLVNEEKRGRDALNSGRFQEAMEVFGRLREEYDKLSKQSINSRFRVEINPTSIDFGDIGREGSNRTVTITNVGSMPNGIKGGRIEGGFRGQYGTCAYQSCAHCAWRIMRLQYRNKS